MCICRIYRRHFTILRNKPVSRSIHNRSYTGRITRYDWPVWKLATRLRHACDTLAPRWPVPSRIFEKVQHQDLRELGDSFARIYRSSFSLSAHVVCLQVSQYWLGEICINQNFFYQNSFVALVKINLRLNMYYTYFSNQFVKSVNKRVLIF